MAMTLIGHYDSPFVRRVGVSLHILDMRFERKLLSVFSNADALRVYAPIGRVPVLVLEDGEALIDSAAILDYLDEIAGPERALLPANGAARREALQLIAFATGASDKAIAIVYERRRTAAKIDQDWLARCRSQLDRALVEIERRLAAAPHLADPRKQPGITVTTMLGYLRLKVAEAVPVGRFPRLDALAVAAEAESAYLANLPTLMEIGGTPEQARSALLRLRGGGSVA
jgi:glutathione S-transferase